MRSNAPGCVIRTRPSLHIPALDKRCFVALVAEVARAGEDHCDAVLVAGVDGLLVAHGTAGLDDGGHAMGGQGLKEDSAARCP